MQLKVIKIVLPVIDQIMIALAFLFFYWLSFHTELSQNKEYIPINAFKLTFLIFNLFWLFLFALFGLYGKWKNTSRFDELISVYKTITVGGVFFLIFAFWVSHNVLRKLPVLGYWAALVILVGAGRMGMRTIQRHLLIKGIGRRPSVIVGTTKLAADMIKRIRRAPALGYDIKGAIPTDHGHHPLNIEGVSVIGYVKDLHAIIKQYGITDILIALELKEEEEIFRLISAADSYDVDFLILPGPADVLAGRMMFNHLYGFPMVRILAEPMPPWEKNVKKMIDVCVSLAVLAVLSPILLLIAILIKLDSRGPVFYVQERVGHRGKPFKLYKFRSMVNDAEKDSGPVWAGKNDPRITRVGRFLRKTRFDELPQLYNILRGNMSWVGPRPERQFFVDQLAQTIPYYPLRLKVKPGLTGWAQIKHSYDSTFDDVREKLKYDLYYIENMSLNMDFKILIATIFVVLGRKGAH